MEPHRRRAGAGRAGNVLVRARLIDLVRWSVVGVSFFTLCALWAIATPAMSSPDEPSHTVKAVAVAHGELSGVVGPRPTTWMVPGALTTVEVPSDYANVAGLNCYATVPVQDASCMPGLAAHDGSTTPAQTAAGHYPPLYYALVGWPSLFLPADPGILVMRLVSAAISTVLVLAGLVCLRGTRGQRGGWTLVRWGALTALTPMALFLFSTINPNGLEISAAFAAWASCWAVFRSPGGRPSRSILVIAALSIAVLANIRALSPLWALVIVALTLLGSGRTVALWRQRRGLVLGALVFLPLVALPTVLWTARHGTLLTGVDLWPQYRDPLRAATDMVLALWPQYQQMIGNQGWFDTPVPTLTLLVWTVSLGTLATTALVRRRFASGRGALLVLLLGVVAGPMLVQFPGVADAGLVWQGRYTLPIAIGVPLLAAWTLVETTRDGAGEDERRLARLMVVAVGVGHAVAFYGAARRYAVGADGPYLTTNPAWASNIGFVPSVVLYVVALAVFVVALGGTERRPRESALPARSDVDAGTPGTTIALG